MYAVHRLVPRFVFPVLVVGTCGAPIPLSAQGDGSAEPVSAPEEVAVGATTVSPEAAATQDDDEEDEVKWYDRIRFSGDFRARYEGFYQREVTTRNRGRLRLRLRMDAEVNEEVRFHLQVASGDPGTPVSTNQTLTSFFQPKPFNLDRAYMAYNPEGISSVTLGGGKFGSPMTRTQMVFDDDLNFEGAFQEVDWSVGDDIGVTVGALQTNALELRSASDSFMFGGFGEVTFDLGGHELLVSVANYGWRNVDQLAVRQASRDVTSSLTNAVVRDEGGQIAGFLSRFNVVDVIAEWTLHTARRDYPLRFLIDYAHNTRAATDRDTGVWLEAAYGDPRRSRQWGAGYTYGWVEQDSTLSAFVFSDMPGTNLRLHMIEASFVPKTGLSLDATLHITKQIIPLGLGPDTWRSRLHLAAVVRF